MTDQEREKVGIRIPHHDSDRETVHVENWMANSTLKLVILKNDVRAVRVTLRGQDDRMVIELFDQTSQEAIGTWEEMPQDSPGGRRVVFSWEERLYGRFGLLQKEDGSHCLVSTTEDALGNPKWEEIDENWDRELCDNDVNRLNCKALRAGLLEAVKQLYLPGRQHD